MTKTTLDILTSFIKRLKTYQTNIQTDPASVPDTILLQESSDFAFLLQKKSEVSDVDSAIDNYVAKV